MSTPAIIAACIFGGMVVFMPLLLLLGLIIQEERREKAWDKYLKWHAEQTDKIHEDYVKDNQMEGISKFGGKRFRNPYRCDQQKKD